MDFFESLKPYIEDRPAPGPLCQHAGCQAEGVFRAPKNRFDSGSYWLFCQAHAREYNEKWNYFAKLSVEEMDAIQRAAQVGDRPSWPFGLRAKLSPSSFLHMRRLNAETLFTHMRPDRPVPSKTRFLSAEEQRALKLFDLHMPLDTKKLKACYVTLVKAHHPDWHGQTQAAHDKLARINRAYSVLKALLKS